MESKQILLVDDEPLILDIFKSFFSIYNYKISTSNTSEDALEKIRKKNFDTIICDLMLDQYDGFQILDSAKKRNINSTCILVTASPNANDKAKALEQGYCYLTKPVHFNTLLHTVLNCNTCKGIATKKISV